MRAASLDHDDNIPPGPSNKGFFIAQMMGLSALAGSLATYLAVKKDSYYPFFFNTLGSQTKASAFSALEQAVHGSTQTDDNTALELVVHGSTQTDDNTVIEPAVHGSTQTDDNTEKAKKEHRGDALIEQEIKEINIAIDNQIEGYKMAVDEILRMKMSSEAGKKEHFPDYFEYLPDKFNQHFITGRNIVREMRINKAKEKAAATAAEKRVDDDSGL